MPKFNVMAYRLKPVFDPLTGATTRPVGSPSTGSVLQNANVNPPTLKVPGRPLQSNPLGRALAGYRARSSTRISGGGFAPRTVSGTR